MILGRFFISGRLKSILIKGAITRGRKTKIWIFRK